MFEFFRRLFTTPGIPRDVEQIVEALVGEGVARSEIKGRHLQTLYKGLRVLPSRPDFKRAESVLASLAEAGDTDQHPLLGLIMETREHPALEFVILNYLAHVDSPVQLFHGRENREFVHSGTLGELVKSGKLKPTELDTAHLDAGLYNALFLSTGFWRAVKGRDKLVVFQTDSIICPGSDYNISEFLDFDYIGSWWTRKRPIGLHLDGGNGGLTVRDWAKTLQSLERFSPERWPGGEDGYFAFHIDLMGGKVGRQADCMRFSTQEVFQTKSWGAHNIGNLRTEQLEAFLDYCPEGLKVLPIEKWPRKVLSA